MIGSMEIHPSISRMAEMADFVYDTLKDTSDIRWDYACHLDGTYRGILRGMTRMFGDDQASWSEDEELDYDHFMESTDESGGRIAERYGIDPWFDEAESIKVIDTLRRGYQAAYLVARQMGLDGELVVGGKNEN